MHIYHYYYSHSQSNINSIQGQVRTAKAEKRMQERLKHSGSPVVIADGERKLSPADERTLQAEKRAAWRKARCVIGLNLLSQKYL